MAVVLYILCAAGVAALGAVAALRPSLAQVSAATALWALVFWAWAIWNTVFLVGVLAGCDRAGGAKCVDGGCFTFVPVMAAALYGLVWGERASFNPTLHVVLVAVSHALVALNYAALLFSGAGPLQTWRKIYGAVYVALYIGVGGWSAKQGNLRRTAAAAATDVSYRAQAD